ncbi:prepilin peptidase [Arthrobacter caoxuetaonis]|uniref:Prepilin peptidase n=1 Tax=Arthrobacter caoxuetaonis TaxID=2886935 RepID=A0A9X1MFM5_9MICC|nr:prepilin peptidase [Arthrobacter caoxuetaonis]MCC3299238.1 prepilin peptidase [Arthrobacter caoxuetaonis]USQ59268.1 prepilin peptidase [Arthrobacter caoxuetaonis]
MSTQTAETKAAETAPDPIRDHEDGLRPLVGRDWLVATLWAIFTGLAASAASVALLPVGYLGIVALLGAGLGLLGYLDHVTQLIRNKHNVIYGIFAAVLLVATQTFMDHQILLPALISAVVTFAFFLVLTMYTGFAGGGDIKLSPIPAALLGAISPVAALLWLLFTFVLCVGGMIYYRITDPATRHTAMGPYMAAAAVITVISYGLLAVQLGI